MDLPVSAANKQTNKHKKHKKEKKSHKKRKVDETSASESSSDDGSEVEQSGDNLISEDDYFSKSEEFRVWLKLAKSIGFEALSTDEARAHFRSFMKEYNSRSLPDMYYQGIPQEIREVAMRSQHRWKFKMSEDEKDKVVSVADSVDFITRADASNVWGRKHPASSSSLSSSSSSAVASTQHLQLRREEQRDEEKNNKISKVKRERERISNYLEDVAPREKSGSFEANLDKRRAAADRIHGARSEKEAKRVSG